MNIDGLLDMNKETRFSNLPNDLKVIIVSQVLSKPNMVILINKLCENNNFICQNKDLYETLWLKYISKKLPQQINFDEFREKYKKISYFYLYANTEISVSDTTTTKIFGLYPKISIIEYIKNKNKYNELIPAMKNIVDYNILTLEKIFNNDENGEDEGRNYEIVYHNTKNIMKLINNIKNKEALDLKILDKIVYIDQLINNATLLMRLAVHNDEKIIDVKNKTSKTVHKHVNDINVLIDRGADVNVKNNIGTTALMYAVKNGYIETKLLIDAGANINTQNYKGNTALIIAMDNNNIDIVKLLLSANPDFNIKNNIGMTPLMYAVQENSVSLDILKTLLEVYPENKINERDDDGKTILMCASNIDKINLLLDFGADLYIKDNQGQNVLWYLTDKNIIKFYLEKGLNENETNNKNQSVLFSYVNDYKMLNILIDAGFDVNLRDKMENTPLIICKDYDCQNLLLRSGADINAVNNLGYNALMVNISYKSIDKNAIINLINKGINVNQKDLNGFTPLFIALFNNQHEIAQYLIQAGADIHTDKIKAMYNIVITNN